jgi:hypothetical protein
MSNLSCFLTKSFFKEARDPRIREKDLKIFKERLFRIIIDFIGFDLIVSKNNNSINQALKVVP